METPGAINMTRSVAGLLSCSANIHDLSPEKQKENLHLPY
jgi:hypothetical protein